MLGAGEAQMGQHAEVVACQVTACECALVGITVKVRLAGRGGPSMQPVCSQPWLLICGIGLALSHT